MMDARQGHAYEHRGRKVIAMTSGNFPKVAPVVGLWLGEAYFAAAEHLRPLPMQYFGGRIP